MNNWVRNIYTKLNVYERNVFGCFINVYEPDSKNIFLNALLFLKSIIICLICKYHRYIKKDILFRYIEVPITTKCSLNCEECNNLIQFYEHPQNFKATEIVRDIKRICCVSEKIAMLRILGGEPLVHPELAYILNELSQIDKIQQVQVVTNGTLIFNEQCLSVMHGEKFSVDISNYGIHSLKYMQLIKQLKENGIRYSTQKNQKTWKAISSCKCRGYDEEKLEDIFALCREDCHSLLDGELHLCARSAHGTDLGLIEKREKEFVNVRVAGGKNELQQEIYDLLNRKSIAACNYCDMFRVDSMQSIPSAKQITKKEALERLRKWRE